MNETIEKPLTMEELRWQCRRGMLELDIMLLSFCNQGYEVLPPEQQELFVQLLRYPDQDLFEWLLGKSIPEDLEFIPIIQLVRESKWTGMKSF